MFQMGDLVNEITHLLFKLIEVPQQSDLLLSGHFDQAAFAAMGHQGGTIEAQPLDVKVARCGQGEQVALITFRNMLSQSIPHRMQDAAWRCRLPEIAFELVTGMAAVHPIIGFVPAITGARLEMVNGEFRTSVRLAHAAVAAAKPETLP